MEICFAGLCVDLVTMIIFAVIVGAVIAVGLFLYNNRESTPEGTLPYVPSPREDEYAEDDWSDEGDEIDEDDESEEDVIETSTDSLFSGRVTFEVKWHSQEADHILIKNNSSEQVIVSFFDQDINGSGLPDKVVLRQGDMNEYILDHMPNSFSVTVDKDEEFQADFERP